MEELKNYIKNLNEEFMGTVGEEYIKLDTGEVFTKTEVNKYISLKIEEFNIERNAQVTSIARENGIEIEQRIINKRSSRKNKRQKEIYDNGEFNILYRKEVETRMALALTLIEEGIYSKLCYFLHFPTNCVMIDGQVPSVETLSDIMGLKERAFRGHLKTLQEKDFIKLVQYGHKKAIYVNPRFCASGKNLEVDTLSMFGLLECDDEKVNSYL